MDKANIAWVFRQQREGYPAGSFFDNVLRAMVSGDPTERFNAIYEAVLSADTYNRRHLLEALPLLVDVCNDVYHGNLTHKEAEVKLTRTLEVLPYLLATALPSLEHALESYILDDPGADDIHLGELERRLGWS